MPVIKNYYCWGMDVGVYVGMKTAYHKMENKIENCFLKSSIVYMKEKKSNIFHTKLFMIQFLWKKFSNFIEFQN